MKKNFTEIEEIIENRITVLEKEYDLDRWDIQEIRTDRKSTRLNSSHKDTSRMPSSA